MADSLTPTQRSENMRRIRGQDTKPEIALRSALHRQGFRFRKNDRRLPGKPDIVLPKYRTVVFVNGCFWHRHEGCSKATTPKTNTEFWMKKFRENVKRDAAKTAQLRDMDWKVLTVWECEISSDLEGVAREIIGEVRSTAASQPPEA
jgi:DNA mismatch endonuclease (patch repair protein)